MRIFSSAKVLHMTYENENDWNAVENHPQNARDIQNGCNVIAHEGIVADLDDLHGEERKFEQSLQYEHDANDPLLDLYLVYFLAELVFGELSQYVSELLHRQEVADGKDGVLEEDERHVNHQRVFNDLNFEESDDFRSYQDSDKKTNTDAAFLESRLNFGDFIIHIILH